MRISAVVPAAGLGIRLKSKVAKPLILINGIPIIIHTLKKLDSHPLIDEIIVVFDANYIRQLKGLIKQAGISKVINIVKGGAVRRQSVKNGLKSLGDTDIVLIHDGVRPFIEHRVISEAIAAVKKFDAVVVGVPLKSTIKRINLKENASKLKDSCDGIKSEAKEVDCTLRRDEIWEIQTPQVFKKDLIVRAYDRAKEIEAPDDAFLVESIGHRVVVVEGSYLNIKITTPEDLLLAQAIDTLKKTSHQL